MKFEEKLAKVLEVESVSAETKFREVEGWCSLMAFGLLMTLENDFGVRISVEDLRKCETIGDLMKLKEKGVQG